MKYSQSLEMRESTPIYSHDYINLSDKNGSFFNRNKKLSIYLSIIGGIILLILCLTAILVPSIYFGLQRTVLGQCNTVNDDPTLPGKNVSEIFTGIRELIVHMPQRGSNAMNKLILIPTEGSVLTFKGRIRALDEKSLSDLSLNYRQVGDVLEVGFKQNYVWPGFGCPTAYIDIYVPKDIILRKLDIDNVLNGPTEIYGIYAKRSYINGGYGSLILRGNTIASLNAFNYAGDITLLNHDCDEINSTTSAVNINSNGNINIDQVSWCSLFTVNGVNGKISMKNVNYLNSTVEVYSRDGIQEITEMNTFKSFSSRTLSGFITFQSSTDLASTYFEMASGSGFSRVEGFSRVNYEENEPQRKKGRFGCANLCEKRIRMLSTRGTLTIKKL